MIYMISEYYSFILFLINKILLEKNIHKNINLHYENFISDPNSINIHVNLEHTLVKEGGRSLENIELSLFKYDNDNKNYLIRIVDLHKYLSSDIVIDYSIPNITNIKTCNYYSNLNKEIYIPPLLYPYNSFTKNRDILLLTTFIHPEEEKRKSFLNLLKNNELNVININNCYGIENHINLLKNTKIILNIRQTYHHDTFEELRCLPALLCGTLVISEIAPLKECVPYHDLIIWANMDNFVETINNVINNYDYYYDKIFNNNTQSIFDKMMNQCIKDLTLKIENFC
jgi:hypothetical protein